MIVEEEGCCICEEILNILKINELDMMWEIYGNIYNII